MEDPANDGSVPPDLQVAILDLLETCKKKEIDIPHQLGSAFFGALSSSRKDTAAEIVRFEDRLWEDKVEHKKAISDSSIVAKALEMMKKVNNPHTIPISLQIKDGCFKCIESVERHQTQRRTSQEIDTVFSRCMIRRLVRTMRGDFSNGKEIIERFPIRNANLVFEQGKTYLVLGGPGSGKSSLLKMIAGILPSDRHHCIDGTVRVNGVTPNTQGVVWSNIVGYIDQIDRLHPYLTVKETCDFAWQCRSGGTHRTSLHDSSPEAAEQIQKLDDQDYFVTTVLESMGLTGVKDTFVGDHETVRGISGGERKRVTISEMAVGRFPIECMDEISTGLDAATTYDICKLLREVNALTKYIKVVTLLQPPPETFALFDDLILLSQGKVIYSGPVEQVVPYFESLGYKLPDRMDAADWLQTLPTKDGAQYLDSPKMHLSSDDFHAKFYASERGKEILEKLRSEPQQNECEQSKDSTKSDETIKTLYKQRYRNSSWSLLRLLTQRECMLWWRDKAAIKARIFQDVAMGIIAGTVFWQGADEVSSVLGILFQSMLFISLGAMQKVNAQYLVRGVLYKHQDANFFPTWTFVVGRSIASIPASVIDGLLYGTLVFWFVGLAHNDGASFGNYIVFVLVTTCASTGIGLLFSIFSAVTKDRSTGQACMAIALVLFILFSGFTVTPNNIPSYWIWLYWLNIFGWAFRGLVVNEYDSGKYDQESAFFDPALGKNLTRGELILRNTGFSISNGETYTNDWAGYSVLYSLLLCVIAVILSNIALTKVRFETGKALGNVNSEIEEDDEDQEVGVIENALSFQKVNLTFKDIHYTVPSSIGNEKIEILKGIDGVVEAGKMTALMGSSGAGKTTLMDVLALRKSSGEISGEVRLNGYLQEEQSFRRCAGYVEQFDTQSAQLTIRETCEFSARLRLDSTDPAVTEESTKCFIDQTLDMLELTDIQDLLVGSDETGGLSLEQKKRLSIAVELVANPSIIFLDEPTSGLDARAAAIVMRGLKRIALTGRAVCATIHQPSVAIFNSFDSLLLLKRGEVVFHGELGNESSCLIEYLQSYQATPLIQPGENPATWMLTTIGVGNVEKTRHQFDYARAYDMSQLWRQCVDKIKKFENAVLEDGLVSFPTVYATTSKNQCIEVMKRTWTVYWRSPSYNRTRIILATVLSFLMGSVYFSAMVPQDETQMRSRMTTIYLSFLVVAVSGMIIVLPFFEAERNMFYRHKSALMYNTTSFAIAHTVAECPFLFGTSLLYTTIFYFLLGFESDAEKFFYYYFFMLFCGCIFTYTGQMFIALCRNAQIAHGFASLLAANTGLFAGILIQPQNIPKFWIFMHWLLPGRYILEGLLTTQFDNNTMPIAASLGSGFYQFLVSTEQCEQGSECYGTAEEWIAYTFGGEFSVDNVPYDIAYCFVVCFLTRIITLLALVHLNYRNT